MAMRILLATALLLLSGVAVAADPATDACVPLPGEGGRVCRSVEAGIDVAARLCRNAEARAVRPGCDVVDGEPVDSARIDAYLAGATHAALDARFHADDTKPLKLAMWPSTHNSYNAEVYAPTLSGLDANQRYSIYDQLRMDMRSVELDVHWWPSANAPGGFDAVMCHAEDAGGGVHAGCTTERTFAEGLEEIASFLRQDAGADEVVLLYVEDDLDGAAGYSRAAETLAAALGDLVFGPADSGRTCADGLPLDATRADVLAANKRVLVVSSTCGEGTAWAALAHDYDASIDQHGLADFTAFPDCGGAAVAYGEKIVRFWEDRTWLTYTAAPQQALTPEIAREMQRCGVGMIGFDLLAPEDGRLDALATR